jgi:hypothetical protein
VVLNDHQPAGVVAAHPTDDVCEVENLGGNFVSPQGDHQCTDIASGACVCIHSPGRPKMLSTSQDRWRCSRTSAAPCCRTPQPRPAAPERPNRGAGTPTGVGQQSDSNRTVRSLMLVSRPRIPREPRTPTGKPS